MKLSYNLKLSQSLKLTPLLQQSLKFLQASQAELDYLIEEYIKDNIFLEKENSYDSKKSYEKAQGNVDNYYDIFENQSQNQSLKDYLIENIGIFSFSERDQLIFSFLIDSINIGERHPERIIVCSSILLTHGLQTLHAFGRIDSKSYSISICPSDERFLIKPQ